MKSTRFIFIGILFLFFFGMNSDSLYSQNYNEELYDAMEYRLLGPFRGGRSAAVTGVPNKPNLFYFGATGGGVWKTTDEGLGEIFPMDFLEAPLAPLQ